MDNRNVQPQTSPESPEPRLTTADLVMGRTERAQPAAQPAPAPGNNHQTAPIALFTREETQDLHTRWTDIQAGFVDEPRRAVEDADSLVAEVMRKLAETFASERQGLETQWNRGDNVSTEDLRLTLQRYRSFFDRLLSL